MTHLRLYFDENVPEAIAAAVRLRGYDVITVRDAERKAASDLDQLRYASLRKRVLFTFNAADFVKPHDEFVTTCRHHSGVLLSKTIARRYHRKAIVETSFPPPYGRNREQHCLVERLTKHDRSHSINPSILEVILPPRILLRFSH